MKFKSEKKGKKDKKSSKTSEVIKLYVIGAVLFVLAIAYQNLYFLAAFVIVSYLAYKKDRFATIKNFFIKK